MAEFHVLMDIIKGKLCVKVQAEDAAEAKTKASQQLVDCNIFSGGTTWKITDTFKMSADDGEHQVHC